MEQVTQQRAPLLEAMQAHRLNRVVRFDVPGHKGGRGNHELAEFLGDRLCADGCQFHEESGQSLSSGFRHSRCSSSWQREAFGAKNAFFIINGATGAIHRQ